MSINQNKSSEFKNVFVTKEQTHNFVVLFLAIFLILLTSIFLYECLKQKAFTGLILVLLFYVFAFFKIFNSSLLINKLKKIKNEVEPESLNFSIYQSSWMRKKIATIWTTLSYLTIFSFILIIYLIINFINKNFTNSIFIYYSYGITIIGTFFIGLINYEIINNNLGKGKRYISAKKINSYQNILDNKQLRIYFKKSYIYVLFSLFIIPWFFMLSKNIRKKFNNYWNK